jgi:hypothetical protein
VFGQARPHYFDRAGNVACPEGESQMETERTYEGSCFCGAVQIAVAGAPVNIQQDAAKLQEVLQDLRRASFQ